MGKTKYYVISEDGEVILIVRATSKSKAIKKYVKGSAVEGRSVESLLEHYEVEQVKVI